MASCLVLPYNYLCPVQKSLLDNCQNRLGRRDEAKTLRSARDKAQEELRDKERELAAAQAENRTLRLQVILHTPNNMWEHTLVVSLTHTPTHTRTHTHTPSCIHNFPNIAVLLCEIQEDEGLTVQRQ